jgi:hypothetical protein
MYSLLLLRTFAMAEQQNLHPLDLPEVKYIWGDYLVPTRSSTGSITADPFCDQPRTLPFSYKYNILIPLNMLEKLGIDPFTSPLASLWVINTLYAKFRGTASARPARDGRTEVAAVHPMWCLANHSCDPNVAWEWQGSIRFTVRQERTQWVGRKPESKAAPGIAAGEEVLGHYCDIDLPVQERREWAVGALGGFCKCPRCLFEANERA